MSFVESWEFERLLERIAANDPSLSEVRLFFKRIEDEEVRMLAEALRRNIFVTDLSLGNNNSIGAVRAVLEVLYVNSSITELGIRNSRNKNSIAAGLLKKARELVRINKDAPNRQEARRLKVLCRIGWMLDSDCSGEREAAVALALDELDTFPEADWRRRLFERLLGFSDHGKDVAMSVDAGRGRVLYRYAAECRAAPGVLMNLLRAHPSLCECRDVRNKLYPFMLLATLPEAAPGDVLEALSLSPSLVNSGIGMSFVESWEFELLLERIAANDPSLSEVNLFFKPIEDEEVTMLAEALRRNIFVTKLCLSNNSIRAVRAILEVLYVNSSITELGIRGLHGNSIAAEDLLMNALQLVRFNKEAPNRQEARRLKVLYRIGWMLDSNVSGERKAAVTLAMDELDTFPEADCRRGLFEHLLGSTNRGMDVAASVDMERGRVLYWYAAECGAAPGVLMNLLQAHPSLCACRDVRHKFYPFMLIATMSEAGVGDVMEALLLSPSLVNSCIDRAC